MTDIHGAVGAYVVDALDGDERFEFETHLAGCLTCQSEAAEFVETMAELAPLVATAPPLVLRSSVMSAIAGARQLPRERVARSDDRTRPLVESGDEAPRRLRVASVTELRPPERPDEVAPLEEHPSVVPDTPWLGITAGLSDELDQDRGRRRDRVLALLVAAVLVMAVVFSGWVYISWQNQQTQMAESRRETDLLTAQDTKLTTRTVSGSPVSFVVSKQRDEALFIANALPNPPAGSVYQLWTQSQGKSRSAGVIRNGGSVRVWLDGPVSNSDHVALSVERAPDGVNSPTGVPIAVTLS